MRECGDIEIDLAEDSVFGHLSEIAISAEGGVVYKNIDGDAFALQLIK
jgi:hypothetical protein